MRLWGKDVTQRRVAMGAEIAHITTRQVSKRDRNGKAVVAAMARRDDPTHVLAFQRRCYNHDGGRVMKEFARSLEEMVRELPIERQAEVRDFVEFLLAKQRSRQRQKPRFDWAGALKDMRDDYTSVDLQHEITRQRSEIE